MTLSKNTFLVSVVSIALLIRVLVVFIYLPDHTYYNYIYGSHNTRASVSDDHRYIEQAANLLNGEGFPKSQEQPPFGYDFRRGPLYPLFISAIFFIGGFNILYVMLAQALISALCIPFIYFISLNYFKEKAARLSCIAWAVFPPSIIWTLAIMRESLIAFFMLLSVWAILLLAKKFSAFRIVLSGSMFGMLLLVDPFAITVMPLFFGLIFFPNGLAKGVSQNLQTFSLRFQSAVHSIVTTVRTDLKKTTAGLLWCTVVLATVSPWLIWTNAILGRPSLGTASGYGVWDDWFTYYKYKSLKKNNSSYTLADFEEYMLRYRLELANEAGLFKGKIDPNPDNIESIKELLSDLRYNSDYVSTTNHSNMKNVFHILKNDPSLYFGEPFGKLLAIKFFDYWLNFSWSVKKSELPNFSNLYVFTTEPGIVIRIWAVFCIVISFVLFLIFIRHCKNARLLMLIWLIYFLFYNIVKFRAEVRYTLPVHSLAIIILCDTLQGMGYANRKRRETIANLK